MYLRGCSPSLLEGDSRGYLRVSGVLSHYRLLIVGLSNLTVGGDWSAAVL